MFEQIVDRVKSNLFKDKDGFQVVFQILWTVLSFCNCILIISSIVLMFTGEDLGEPELIQSRKMVVYTCIILLLIGLLGLVGTILEHLGLLIAYAVLWAIIVVIKGAELRSDNCLSFIIAITICIGTVVYIALIRYILKINDTILLTRKFSRKIAG